MIAILEYGTLDVGESLISVVVSNKTWCQYRYTLVRDPRGATISAFSCTQKKRREKGEEKFLTEQRAPSLSAA